MVMPFVANEGHPLHEIANAAPSLKSILPPISSQFPYAVALLIPCRTLFSLSPQTSLLSLPRRVGTSQETNSVWKFRFRSVLETGVCKISSLPFFSFSFSQLSATLAFSCLFRKLLHQKVFSFARIPIEGFHSMKVKGTRVHSYIRCKRIEQVVLCHLKLQVNTPSSSHGSPTYTYSQTPSSYSLFSIA
ncbi:hypothetical protein GE21DRAFT_1042681 [Neurospora crassa]|nr:hypothetical protein GE21DRAFT_1042681 [Neurospora crassa]